MKNYFLKKVLAGAMAMALTVCTAAVSMPVTEAHAASNIDGGSIIWGESYTLPENENYEYTFRLEKSGRFRIQYVTKSTLARISIYDFYGNEVGWDSTTPANQTTTVWFDLLAGDYRLVADGDVGSFVTAFSESGETYSENYTEKNNEQSMATEIKSNASFTGQFASNDDKDYYKLDASKSGVYAITVNSGVNKMRLGLYSEDLSYSYEITDITGGTHKYALVIPEGTYYLVVTNANTNFTGTYKIKTSLSSVASSAVKSVSCPASKKLKATVTKKSGVEGYQIQIATNTSFTSNKKTASITSTSKTFTGLKSGKKYYVRVRTYVTAQNGSKVYSGWSKAKSVTVK